MKFVSINAQFENSRLTQNKRKHETKEAASKIAFQRMFEHSSRSETSREIRSRAVLHFMHLSLIKPQRNPFDFSCRKTAKANFQF